MEVKVEELELAFHLELMHLTQVLSGDSYLSGSGVAKQIDDVAGSVSLKDALKVSCKWLFCHFRVPCEMDILSQASLFPKNGYRPSNLHMTDQKSA